MIQTGVGLSLTNRPLVNATPNAPSGLTLSLISGGVKYDWTDNSGGLAQTEIWCRNDSGISALAYTISAGIVTKSETGIEPVDLRYCKIRSKVDSLYSDFTAEQSIAMLYATEYINQTAWCTAPLSNYYTTVCDANWSGDGSKLTCDGSLNNGALQINFFYPGTSSPGYYYKTKYTIGSRTSGKFAVNGSIAWVNTTGTYWTKIQAINGVTDRNLYVSSSGGSDGKFTGTITTMSIKRIIMP